MDREVEYLKQRIASNIEHRKTLWTVEALLSGGLATLLTNPNSYVKIGLIIIGFIFFFSIASGIRSTKKNLDNLFKELKGLIK